MSILVIPTNFMNFNETFLDGEMNDCLQLFPVFDKQKLHNKQSILYSREEYRTLFGAIRVLHFYHLIQNHCW